jgi:flagellar biogenesis protein FliO
MTAVGTMMSGRLPLIVAGAIGLLAGAAFAREASTDGPFAEAPVTADTRPRSDQPIRFLDTPAPSQPDANPLGTAPEGGTSGSRAVIVLTLLVGGAAGLLLMRKKSTGKAAKTPTLAVLGQVRVAGRWQVALVKVPGKTLVLGATEKGLSLLSTIDAEDAVEAGLDDDELVAAVREDDRVDIGRRTPPPARPDTARPETGRSAIDPRTAYIRTDTRGSANEPFGRLLDELTRGTGPQTGPMAPPLAARDRMKTPEAQALRARLERYQNPTSN